MPTPLEGEEQATLFSWAHMRGYLYPELELMFHIPNGGKRGKAEAARFRAEGVKAGVPDICLPVARGGYNGLFIELKRCTGGRVSSDQSIWIDRLETEGYRALVCHGWQEAAQAIEDYLRGGGA
ncbi:MAG: VRR-NUC domain-containing protein [Oscillospiraceae bacterium]|nr:VRR-NUC domain-containing protein [Oscillospiraceae bacterium]